MQQKLSFLGFVNQYFPEYKIDKENMHQFDAISAWLSGGENFAKMGDYYSLKKGWLFVGDVGVGKTDTMWLIGRYLSDYLNDKRRFRSCVAWEMAADFSKKETGGHSIFQSHKQGNMFYDELCFMNKGDAKPTREEAQYMGNKVLIGAEIIMQRYNLYKSSGAQTHFTTNTNPEVIHSVYGSAVYDRLMAMCNVLVFTGKSRRWTGETILYEKLKMRLNDAAKYVAPVSDREHQEIKSSIDLQYRQYCDCQKAEANYPALYHTLMSYGCNVNPEGLYDRHFQDCMNSDMYENRRGLSLSRKTEEERRLDRYSFCASVAKTRCVVNFFNELMAAGSKTVFGMVVVNVDKLINNKN